MGNLTREKMSFSLDNPTYALLVKCAAVLGLNLILKAPLTGYYRVTRGALLNREDAIGQVGNDLENIPMFLILALLYVSTNPDPDMAKYHFIGFTVARVGFSISYLCSFSFRGLFFIGGLGSLLSMTVRMLLL